MRQSKRIFMNEADASPGNGAPATPPTPASPPAQNAAPLDVNALVDLLDKKMDEKLTAQQNSTFAALRKAGVLGKDKPTEPPTPPPASPSAAAPAPTGLSMADVEAVVERTRLLTERTVTHKLSAAQASRMKAALASVPVESYAAEADAYLADMGLVRTAQEPTTPVTPVPQPQPNGQPISDKGSPAPGGVVNWERELAENPIGMSTAARAAMDAKYGREKAVKMRLEASQAQAARIKVTTR